MRNEEEVTAERVAYGLGLEMHTARLLVADVPTEREQVTDISRKVASSG
ncbi:MAG: hypothetical protein ACP5E9_09495 [Candidatus Methanospirareceae archaeon]